MTDRPTRGATSSAGTAPMGGGWLWLAGAVLAVALGAAVGLSALWSVGALLALVVAYVFARSGVQTEIVVALYWIVFDLYLSAFAGTDVPGLFYPFYVALFLGLAIRLLGPGLRGDPVPLGIYLAFLFVAAYSFLSFDRPIDVGAVQRVLAYLFGGLVLVQVGSRRGLDTIAVGALAGSGLTSVWLVVNAAQTGFGYRGDVAMDPNVVAFLVGIGAMIVAAIAIDRIGRGARLAGTLALALLLALHVYAFLLMASRGVSVALLIGISALLLRAAIGNRRTLLFLPLMVAVAAGGFLLPGGQGLVSRLESEHVQTAGDRLPIWEFTVASYSEGDVRDLLLGHGFRSSELLVQRRFAVLNATHQAYLQVLYEFGLVGLAFFLALHVTLLVRAWALRNRYGLIMVGVLAFLLAVDLSLSITNNFMYWTALGFVMALGTWGAGPQATRGKVNT